MTDELATGITSDEIASAASAAGGPPSSGGATGGDEASRGAASATGDRANGTNGENGTNPNGGGSRTAIPFDEHERIVRGFHERLDRAAWASNLDANRVRRALTVLEDLEAEQARGSRRGGNGANGNEPQRPQPDVKDERGELYYSPQQAAALSEFLVRQAVEDLRAEFREQIDPIANDREQSRQEAARASQIDYAARTFPKFTEHMDAITDRIVEHNAKRRDNPGLPPMTLAEAYILTVIPGLVEDDAKRTTRLKSKWLAELDETTRNTSSTDDDTRARRTSSDRKKKDADMEIGELIADEVAQRKTRASASA